MTKTSEHPVYGALDGEGSPSSEIHGFVTDGLSGVYIVKTLDGAQAKPAQNRVVIEPADVDSYDEPIWDDALDGRHLVPSYVDDEFGEDEAVYIGPEEVVEPEAQKHIVPAVLSATPQIDEDAIPFGNVIDVDEEYVDGIVDRSKELTEQMTELMLAQHAPLAFAGESANAHLEAVMRDCFGADIEADTTLESYIHAVTQADLISYLLDQQKHLPKPMKRLMLKQFITNIIVGVDKDLKQARSHANFKKYRSELENAQARTKTKGSNLGTTRGFSKPRRTDGVDGA